MLLKHFCFSFCLNYKCTQPQKLLNHPNISSLNTATTRKGNHLAISIFHCFEKETASLLTFLPPKLHLYISTVTRRTLMKQENASDDFWTFTEKISTKGPEQVLSSSFTLSSESLPSTCLSRVSVSPKRFSLDLWNWRVTFHEETPGWHLSSTCVDSWVRTFESFSRLRAASNAWRLIKAQRTSAGKQPK